MRGNSYPRDGPGTYFISGYFGILGFPWLAIGMSPTMAQMKDDWPIKTSYYPAPILVTDQDLQQVDRDTPQQPKWSRKTKAEFQPERKHLQIVISFPILGQRFHYLNTTSYFNEFIARWVVELCLTIQRWFSIRSSSLDLFRSFSLTLTNFSRLKQNSIVRINFSWDTPRLSSLFLIIVFSSRIASSESTFLEIHHDYPQLFLIIVFSSRIASSLFLIIVFSSKMASFESTFLEIWKRAL